MNDKENPKRVLHIVSSMDRGGAETLLMNIYRNMDRGKVQFDFITHSARKGDFNDEIIFLGGKIFQISSLGEIGSVLYLKELKKIMSKNNYIAIHSHTDYQSGFPALAAKICGIQKRICHSHSNDWPQGKSYRARLTLKVLQTLIKMTATNYCSCSIEAAEFMFGKKAVAQGKVEILKNGIDINQFIHLNSSRDSVIQELNLPEKVKIIGHVGRFSESKNHLFILNVLKKVIEKDSAFVALLIGDGPLKGQIEKEAERLGILKNIRFLGVRADIPRLMKAFDVFLFPSLFEGFGIVTLEAQCAGTPCIVSDEVPKTTDMGLNLITYVSLEEDLTTWSKEINRAILMKRPDKKMINNHFIKYGFSIQENVPRWLSLYLKDNSTGISNSFNLLRS
ncbi:group 1 glycosyl transferase [Neobacillus bataviensis LMG 21833]|uniref:Group 1 glycosyl transferase n=1 Tax=Neobacillus bataviensis LMG 21833 TaxID=1117379 RepID=K6DA37_9BACI|nr:glycosyltransferase family 1 protein [Neobacillus bataviensis]EKN69402.1 group 1 glycosyl transferase [Neobacillus bataviensis LMG 21833]